MEMNIHSILPEEIAAMGGHSNRILNEKTGCIGYLTANLNATAPVFESSWHDRTPRLNTPEFTDDFNDMMDALRQGILKSPAERRAYCAAHPDSLCKTISVPIHGMGFASIPEGTPTGWSARFSRQTVGCG